MPVAAAEDDDWYGPVLVVLPADPSREGFVARQTGHPDPFHVCRQVQWNTCWQSMVMRPVVSSMRSRQTGQVGSSTRSAVGGGKGRSEFETEPEGSWKRASGCFLGVSTVIDLINVT